MRLAPEPEMELKIDGIDDNTQLELMEDDRVMDGLHDLQNAKNVSVLQFVRETSTKLQ